MSRFLHVDRRIPIVHLPQTALNLIAYHIGVNESDLLHFAAADDSFAEAVATSFGYGYNRRWQALLHYTLPYIRKGILVPVTTFGSSTSRGVCSNIAGGVPIDEVAPYSDVEHTLLQSPHLRYVIADVSRMHLDLIVNHLSLKHVHLRVPADLAHRHIVRAVKSCVNIEALRLTFHQTASMQADREKIPPRRYQVRRIVHAPEIEHQPSQEQQQQETSANRNQNQHQEQTSVQQQQQIQEEKCSCRKFHMYWMCWLQACPKLTTFGLSCYCAMKTTVPLTIPSFPLLRHLILHGKLSVDEFTDKDRAVLNDLDRLSFNSYPGMKRKEFIDTVEKLSPFITHISDEGPYLPRLCRKTLRRVFVSCPELQHLRMALQRGAELSLCEVRPAMLKIRSLSMTYEGPLLKPGGPHDRHHIELVPVSIGSQPPQQNPVPYFLINDIHGNNGNRSMKTMPMVSDNYQLPPYRLSTLIQRLPNLQHLSVKNIKVPISEFKFVFHHAGDRLQTIEVLIFSVADRRCRVLQDLWQVLNSVLLHCKALMRLDLFDISVLDRNEMSWLKPVFVPSYPLSTFQAVLARIQRKLSGIDIRNVAFALSKMLAEKPSNNVIES